MIRRLSPLLVLFVIAALYGYGALEFAENRIMDLRFHAIERQATGEIVLVDIDERSLREIDVWPWPRRHHASAIDRLFAAGARAVAIDLDLSSRSNPEDDQILAEAARRAGKRLILSAFRQAQRGAAGESVTYRTKPLRAFRESARLAVVNFYPEPDGLVRQATVREPWGLKTLPTLPAVLSGSAVQAMDSFFIDFSIRPESIPRIAFADILSGQFDRSAVDGRTIIIGASAASLGDIVAVPVYAAVPGPLLQALVAESILQGRTLQRSGLIIVLLGTLVLALLLGWSLNACSWWTGAVLVTGAGAALAGLSIAIQAWFPVSLDLAPWLLTAVLSYVASLITRINDQSLKLLLQRLALRRRDTFMRRIFDSTFDGILTVDEAGTVRTFNAAAERIFGYRAQEVIGKPCGLVLESVLTTRVGDNPLALASLDVGAHEARGRHASGARPHLELAVTHMEQEEGRLLVLLARDVTDVKRREREMNRLAQRYAQVAAGIEATTTGVVLTDPNQADNPVIFINPAFTAMTGYTRKEVLDRAFTMLSGEETDRETLQALDNAIAEARSASVEVLHYGKDGTAFWSRVQLSPVRDDDGTLLFFVWIFNDISENKQYEKNLIIARDEAVQANRMKSEFLAAMSHELRTPLNAIIGFSEMMEAEILGPLGDARYRGYAHDIQESGTHLREIIMDILDMAKIESGKFELMEEEVLAAEAITACLRMIGERAADAEVSIAAEIPEHLPKFRADPRVFKHIVLNLLSNAVKFTRAGGKVSVGAIIAPDKGIRFHVADTGIGMAEKDIEIALQPFAQVDGRLNRKYEGIGLGLPLARSFIEQHGGTLEITSEIGNGTTVIFSIPPDRILVGKPPSEADASKQMFH